MEPLKSIKNQLKKIPLDQITIDQIGKSVSNNQFDEACELILKNIPQENAIAILDTLGICTDSQKRLEQILQNVINSSRHPSVSRSRSGSMSPTTDGSTSNDSISSVELINPQVNTGKTESSGYVSPTTDSDLSDEELFSESLNEGTVIAGSVSSFAELESTKEQALRRVLSIDIWGDSKLVADFFKSGDEYPIRSPIGIIDQSNLMEFKDEQSTRGKDFKAAKDHLLIICEEDSKPKMFLREINPGDIFEDSSFDQIGLQVKAKVKLKFDEYGEIVSLGSVSGVLSSYDSNNLKFALNSLEKNKFDTLNIKVQPFSEEGYEYWARDFKDYSDQAMQLNQQLLGPDFFGVPTLNPNNIVKPSNIPQFTCFDRKYTFSDPESVIFTSQLLKEPLDNFIMYRPQRVLLHEVAARLLSTCQFDDEQALHSVVNKIVRSSIRGGGFQNITKEFDSGFEKLLLDLKFNVFKSGDVVEKYKSPEVIDKNSTTSSRQLFQYLTEDEVGIVAETLEKIRSYETSNPELAETLAGKDGKYILLKHILATKLQVNRWRKLEFHKDVQKFAKQVVDQYLKDESEVKTLDYVPCDSRQTVFVNGGVSSGKGSVNNLREEVFQEKNVKSYLTFNKDSVKGALYDFSKGEKTQRYLASQLCQTEASEIMNRVKREVEESIDQKGVAPHMLVDMVYQSPTDMDLAIKGGGELTMFMISTDVETAGKRSLIRGESSGRFEATATILNTHKAVASQFNDRLKHFTEGKEKPKIQVYLYDNNVAKGESPTLCAEYNLKDMKMVIHDESKTLAFFRKTAINGAAKSIEEAYVSQNPDLKAFIAAQEQMGFAR